MADHIKNHIRDIGDKTVIIQSCWLDPDLDIQANIGIRDGARVDYCRVTITAGNEILYLSPVPIQMRERYDGFLCGNIGEVLDLIKGLLTPQERMRLDGWEQASLF